MIEKKIPGKEWERLVYNKLDQVVLTQDSILSKAKQWVYSKYDAFGRVVSSGLYTNTTVLSRAALQALVDEQTGVLWESRTGTDYTNIAFPQSCTEVQLVNYYDDYNILNLPYNQSANYSKKLKSLLTASKVKVLGTTGDYLWMVNYYDEEGRVVKIYKQHYLGGLVNINNYDEIENTYNFAGELTASNRIHRAGAAVTTIANRYEYDHMRRKQATFEAINGGGEVVLNKLDYNEIGQLLKKSVHSTDGITFTQNNTYAYNPRGWMTKVNNPDAITPITIFGMELTYGDRANSFNGNISGINWKTKVPAVPGLTENKQSYVYDYDNLNRLIKAGYTTSGAADKFNEEISYDVMGNINTLKRRETTTGYLNSFAYNYTNGTVKGNQLMGIMDAGTAAQSSNYQYDENGSQKSDSRKGLTIAYNMLNLPKTITKTSTGENLNYTYDATGQKLRKILGINTRDYISGIEYNNGTIEFIQTEEGRALPGSGYTYEYMLKDHLGNIRATVKQNGEIVQVQDYYAFGLEMNPGNSKSPSPNNLYRYNGKEKQTELSLDQLDYGARFYDPVIGRWNVVDPLAELGRRWSPYTYGFNNPIKFTDPDGMKGESTHTDMFGNVLAIYDDNDLSVYRHKNASTKEDIDKAYFGTSGTSGGGEKMGETWTPFGFADFGYFENHGPNRYGEVKVAEGAKIDFNSSWAQNRVKEILENSPSAYKYSTMAGGSQPWDIKAHAPGNNAYFGSLLWGKFASARDAGNIAAGIVAENSNFPTIAIDYGFGAYNQSKNNKSAAIGLGISDVFSGLILPPLGIYQFLKTALTGEDRLTRDGINVGKKIFR